MTHPAKEPRPTVARSGQPSPVETADPRAGTDHGADPGRECRHDIDSVGPAHAPEDSPDAPRPAAPPRPREEDTLDPAEVMGRIAAELVRMHALSLDLQEVFSRALDQGNAGADLIQDAQGFDQLSQVLENLSRLLERMAGLHPEAPTATQVESCLTLHDLRARLARPPGPPPASPAAGGATQGSDRTPRLGPACERALPPADGGDISWL